VYRNTGGSFSEDTGISLTDVFRSSVAFGDYDNDDDLDILITGYDNNWNPIAKVYRNTGGSFSEDTGISLTGVGASTVAFGDYDNDGDLDILLTGEFSYNNVTAKVYRNTGGSFSEDIGISLTGVVDSSVAFGDYDNDGDLDILLTGYSDSGIIAKVYRNTGGSFSEDTGISLTGVVNSSVAFGDYDNDGDLDILLTGYSSSGNIAKVYRNTGGSFSEDTGIKLTGVKSGSAVFGDYDNDGDLDILLTGSSDSVYIAKVYRNTGGSFSEDTDISLTGVRYSSVAFGDYDNDGDLDILLTGDSDSDQSCRIYKNNYVVSNTSPSAPSHLTSVITGQKVALSWSAGSDAQTMSPTGLSYNLIIGSSSGACDIVAPMSLPHSNGYRQIAARGLIQSLTTTVHINETGTYYWRVQSIDTAFSGSSFSNEYSFTIIDIAPPIPGNNGLISSSTFIPSTSKNIFNWTVASDSISLTSDLEYRIYTSCISYGDHADAWEEFASAASNWVSNTNSYVLNASTHAYHFVIIVRDTSGNKAIYKPLHISLYTEMADIDIAGVYYSSVAYGDYDNDGDLDILLTGYVSFNSMFKFFFLDRIKA
jgi:predicted nucleotidyltransferase